MIRVGFPVLLEDQRWLGGLQYFHNLFSAILALPERRIEPVILIGSDGHRAVLKDFPPLTILRNSVFGSRSTWARLQRRLQWASHRCLKRDLVVEAVLRWHGISVLSHSHPLGFGLGLPVIGWIPDFQHVHLPEFFSAEEIAARDAHYGAVAEASDIVILSSRAAARDFGRFSPQSAHKARVLSFVAGVPEETSLPSRAALAERYGIAGPYFVVANQFWAHKNHRLIIDALHLLKAQGLSLPVVASGHQSDYRWPGFYDDLMRHAAAEDVLDCFKVVGVIPRADLLGLMKHGLALLTPSRFEGWSTTIEEAKTLGLRVIASDIAVHREQAPPGALYVDPDKPEELAAAMAQVWAERDRPPIGNQAAPFEERRRAFARSYEAIVIEACERSNAMRPSAESSA